MKTTNKVKFHLQGNLKTRQVFLNGKRLDPTESQKVINHSPDGFMWGYGGSGPAQLSLAICIELFGLEKAKQIYQDFKFKLIAGIPQSNFDLDLEYEG